MSHNNIQHGITVQLITIKVINYFNYRPIEVFRMSKLSIMRQNILKYYFEIKVNISKIFENIKIVIGQM